MSITEKTTNTIPYYPTIEELRKAAKCVYIITEQDTAKDLYFKLNGAANMIEELQDLIIWMTGCGYDFCQHEYFCKKRDKLLLLKYTDSVTDYKDLA